jgi:hypothetical protein
VEQDLRGRGSFGVQLLLMSLLLNILMIMVEWRNADTTINWDVAVQKNAAGAYVPDSGRFRWNETRISQYH